MVYKRTYRRNYRRRANYTPRKRFTRYNLYKNRSSTAQANQLYRLNKKVNAIEYKTKPEVKIAKNMNEFSFGNLCSYAFGSPTGATFLNSIKGNLCRLQDATFYFSLYLSPNATQINLTATVRIVIYQYKESRMINETAPENVFNITAAERAETNDTLRKGYYTKAINGPLAEGISAKYKVLRDFKISLGLNTQRSFKKAVIKKGLLHIRKNADTLPKGALYWVALATTNQDAVDESMVRFQVQHKLAYIDED
nr:MAG: capsid protein [Virus sp.]